MAGPISSSLRAAARPAGDASARVRLLRSQLGKSAATAVGDDIPRPRPIAEALPAEPSKDGLVLMPRQQLTVPQVNALLRKMRDGGELTLTELYYLTDAGALPDSALKQIDNLETSSIDLPDTEVNPAIDNLSPNTSRVKASDPDRVYNEINQLSNPQEAANPTQVSRTLARLDKVLADPDAKALLYQRFGNADFAESRIAALRQLAADGVARDAEKIDVAAQSRAAAGKARQPVAALPLSAEMAAVSRRLAANELPEALPELATSFNALPQDTRIAIASRLETQHPQLARALRAGESGPELSGDGVSQIMAPRSDIDGMLLDLENARRAGDSELAESLSAQIRAAADADGQNGIAKDIQAYQQRRDAIAALRREMVASRPDVAADTAAARAASVSPGAPAMRTPGARSVEVSGSPLDDADLPSSYDDALARLREQLFDSQIRPSNPVTAEEASALAAGAGMEPKSLPLAFKARPERRSISSRGGVTTREEAALEALRAARELSATASTPALQSSASEAMKGAQTQIKRAFPVSKKAREQGKRINGMAYRDALDSGVPKEKARQIADAAEQQFLDGLRVRSDESLNRPSQQETARGLLDTIVGYRDRPAESLRRSSPDFTSGERAANAADAQDTMAYSPDDTTPSDMMPEGLDANDMEMLGEGGKRGRLGGRQRQSRVSSAMDQFFTSRFGSGANPLDPEKFPFGGDPKKVADYVMRTEANTRVEGSPSWEITRDDLAAAIEDHFGSARGRRLGVGIEGETQPNVNHLPAPMSGGGVTPGATAVVDGADLPAVDAQKTAAPKQSPPGRKPLASDVNLASSATDISDPSDLPPVGAATTAPSKSYSKAEIKEAADAARDEAIRQASDEGMSRSAAKKAGADAAAKVRKEMEAANATVSKAPAATTAPAPAAASPSLAPVEATAGLPAASTTKVGGDIDGSGSLPPVGKDSPASTAGPGVGSATPSTQEPVVAVEAATGTIDAADAAKKVDDAATSGPKKTSKKSGEGKPKPEPNKPRSSLPRWLLGAGAVGGLVALSNMGGSGTGAQASDVPPMPVPPGSDGASLGALSDESAIDRALARIRGSRMGVSVPTTQVIQNWTGRN